jgi:two-component system phosphate regulon response regulator OmpR
MGNTVDDKRAKILVLDDDAELRALLQRYLGEQGFAVRAVADAAQLDRLLQREPFDVLVLDLMMPGEDGLSVCRRLRVMGETIPIIMLTARGDPVDRIVGLEMGADDYLSKPFNPRELVARLQAMLRRQQMLGAALQTVVEAPIVFGPFELDLSRRQLRRGDAVIALSSGEFELLRVLAANPHRPLGRERLIELAKGRDHEALERAIDVQILRLRRHIETDAAAPRYIQTVRGVGYVFVPEPDAP